MRAAILVLLAGLRLAVAAVATAAQAGCSPGMEDQPRPRPLGTSPFFEDGMASRPSPAGTVARGQLRLDEALYRGRIGDQPVATFPFAVTRAVLERGRGQYGVFCAPCHDSIGTGNGRVVQRGFRRPASFHDDRLRQAPVGHLFDVITRGFGAMPGYEAPLPAEDRWAIVAYLRALQLSQRASEADVPSDERERLGNP